MKTQEEKLKEEIEQLEKHGESECPECNICMVCTMVAEKKAELKGYSQAKQEARKEVLEKVMKIIRKELKYNWRGEPNKALRSLKKKLEELK